MSTDSADYERFSKLTSVNDALRRLGDECEAEVDALKAKLERIEGERDRLQATVTKLEYGEWGLDELARLKGERDAIKVAAEGALAVLDAFTSEIPVEPWVRVFRDKFAASLGHTTEGAEP